MAVSHTPKVSGIKATVIVVHSESIGDKGITSVPILRKYQNKKGFQFLTKL